MEQQPLLDRLDSLLNLKRDRELRQLLLQEEPHEIADAIDALPHGRRKTFALLPPEKQAQVVVLLAEASRNNILPRLHDASLTRLLHFLEDDNATDILQMLPAKRQATILEGLPDFRRKRIETLLTFGAETAGGIMDLHFIDANPQSTVQEVTEAVHAYAKQNKQVPTVLLRLADDTLWVPARSLLSSPKTTPVNHIAVPVSSVPSTADREYVLETMSNENSDIAYVTDDAGKILGIIHLNDLLRIAEVEASEDAYRMGAVAELDTGYLESSFISIWRKRVGWLSVLFVAELFTFTALARFEHSIDAVTALALFVPLVISTGGNSGSQAATLITRAMALGDVAITDWFRVLRRELLMGIALGIALGFVGYARAALTPQSVLGGTSRWDIGMIIGLSVASICIWGTLVGSMLPLLFKRFGFDPAYASSPFVATFVDVTGIVIYFSIANFYILT